MGHGRDRIGRHIFSLTWLVTAAAVPAGCKSGSCDPDLVNHAVEFLEAHQSCAVDADCVIVPDFCGTLPNGFCGQLVMNAEGKASSEWADISKELDDCAPEECTMCGAARGTACSEGSCHGP